MIKYKTHLEKQKKDPEYRSHHIEEKKIAELSIRIAKTRIKKGLSQKELANLAGLTQQQVSKVESAKNSNLRTFLKVTEALDLQVSLT